MFSSKLLAKSLLTAAITFTGIAQAAPVNLDYDYLNLKGGVGQLGVDADEYREDIRTTNFSGRWSGLITENIYSTLSAGYLSGDGNKTFPGQKYNLETTQTTYSVIVGGVFGVAQSTDIFAGVGIGGIKQDSELEITKLGNRTTEDLDVDKTGFAWELGIRREFSGKKFELEAIAEGIAEQASLSVSAPISINENIAIVPGFTFTEEGEVKLYKNHSMVNLGLRFNF